MSTNGKAKVISAHHIQKTVEWGRDVFDNEVMAISELKGPKLEHQIIFDEFEQQELYRMLGEKFPGQQQQSAPRFDDTDDDDLEDELDDLTDDEEEPKFLILETRQSGGKKRTVLNWCEDTAEALDTLMTVWKNGDMSTLAELEEKVKIVKYTEIVALTDLWEGPQDGDDEEEDDK